MGLQKSSNNLVAIMGDAELRATSLRVSAGWDREHRPAIWLASNFNVAP